MSNTFRATGNWGTLICDVATGNVVKYEPDTDATASEGYYNITRLDPGEWRRQYPNEKLEGSEHDILDFGSWDKSGHYEGPVQEWRDRMRKDRGL